MVDESFEYAIKKDVRNNPVVRELDRERHREMWRALAVGLFVVAVLIFSVWRRAELLRHGYDIDELNTAIQAEEETRRQLQLEIETRRSLARIELLAREELGMMPPEPGDYGVIQRGVADAPPDGSVVARR